MNQYSRLPIDIALVRHPGQDVLRLHVHRDALRDWCLGLCLLKEGLVQTFTVVQQGARETKVRFAVGTQPGAKARVALNENANEVLMTKNNLDYVYHFFLKYYRDGVAEVDHLDLEAEGIDTGKNEAYITFYVSESRAPMTSGEAQRQLDRWS